MQARDSPPSSSLIALWDKLWCLQLLDDLWACRDTTDGTPLVLRKRLFESFGMFEHLLHSCCCNKLVLERLSRQEDTHPPHACGTTATSDNEQSSVLCDLWRLQGATHGHSDDLSNYQHILCNTHKPARDWIGVPFCPCEINVPQCVILKLVWLQYFNEFAQMHIILHWNSSLQHTTQLCT